MESRSSSLDEEFTGRQQPGEGAVAQCTGSSVLEVAALPYRLFYLRNRFFRAPEVSLRSPAQGNV